jgi:hypothetical protein
MQKAFAASVFFLGGYMFRSIASLDFPPFKEFRLDFRPVDSKPSELGEVHILTGVNGTGKTRILSALAAMLGGGDHLVSRMKEGQDVTISGTGDEGFSSPLGNWPDRIQVHKNGASWTSSGPFANMLSKLPAFAYSGTAYVKDAPVTVLGDIKKPERAACLSFIRTEAFSKDLLQAIANVKIQSAMEAVNEGDSQESRRATAIVQGIEFGIQEITGMPFTFQMKTYPKVSIGVRWGGNQLQFDTLPDGLRSIIGWLAHAVVMMDIWLEGKGRPMDAKAIFLLDEIECHLHPAWQRRILPAFQRLFPNSQVFVATHSPFVISSINHGWIYPFSLADGTVKCGQPVAASSGDSYIAVLEDIMGVKEWYDPETERLLSEFRKLRDAVLAGDHGARPQAIGLAHQISGRGMELAYLMGKEMRQLGEAPAGAHLL